MRLSYMNLKLRRLWDLASVAVSWDCCTWMLLKNELEREYGLSLITTAPSVIYHVYKTDGEMVAVDNPSLLPDTTKIEHIEEPFVKNDDYNSQGYGGNGHGKFHRIGVGSM